MLLAIGLTGPPGSGKGSVIEIISSLADEQNIETKYFSLSDEIRNEAGRQGIPPVRDNLKRIADDFRARKGSHIWAALTATKIEAYLFSAKKEVRLIFIDGLRNPNEIKELRRRFEQQFKLLGVVASSRDIQRNLKDRNRGDEAQQVLEDTSGLRALINSEMGQNEPEFGHNIAACLDMVDWPLIHNDGSLAELKEKVHALAQQYIFSTLVTGC